MSGYAISMRTFEALLTQDESRPVLAFLNGMTGHRFTGLFRFDGGNLLNVSIFDREESLGAMPTIPIEASYCVFVRDGQSPFAVENSMGDERVAGHSKRLDIQSYCGVAVRGEDGAMIGTVCHFDSRPMPADGHMMEFLEQASPLLARFATRA